MQIKKPATATNSFPSDDEATEDHCSEGELCVILVLPESVEVNIGLVRWLAATNLLPSADEATVAQLFLGALVACIHVIPKSGEVTIMPLSVATATNLLPSADEVTANQFADRIATCIHVWDNEELITVNQLQRTAAVGSMNLTDFMASLLTCLPCSKTPAFFQDILLFAP
jgi:uncharacterized protein involved in tolerance to divalent cations